MKTAKGILLALVLAGLPLGVGGCAFDSTISIEFTQGSPAVVKESFNPEPSTNSIRGKTTRRGQIARIDCRVTIAYDVKEATGSAVLVQTYVAHLRTRALRAGTAYELDCAGPLIVQLPVEAFDVQATATDASGQQSALRVHSPVRSVPLASGKHLRAEPNTRFALVTWPPELADGDYRVELSFGLPEARAIHEKVLYAASVSCSRSEYLQPIVPAVSRIGRVPRYTIQPSAQTITISVPRIVAGIGSYAEGTRTLSC